jgi:hypothetical protein
MLKLIAFFVGVAVGLSGGIYWSVHHPSQANTVAAAEERKFIELQLQASQAIKQKLDQMASKQQQSSGGGGGGGPGSGFLSSHAAPAVSPGEINSVRDQQDQQIRQLQARLNQLPK